MIITKTFYTLISDKFQGNINQNKKLLIVNGYFKIVGGEITATKTGETLISLIKERFQNEK